jgi:hypothetical protein
MAAAKFKWTFLHDVVIGVTGTGDMPDAAWKTFLAEMAEQPVTKYIQFTPGATQLTSVQRKAGVDLVLAKKMKVVMITDSQLVRGIVTAASWLGLKVASWRSNQMEEAVKSLDVPAHYESAIVDAIQKLASEIGKDSLV